MNRLVTVSFLAIGLFFITGCKKSDVKYSDLQPATTATVSNDAVTIHLGSDLMASACWTRPKVKIEGSTIFIVGYRTLQEQNLEFEVRLPATVNSNSITVIWIDPDGSKVSVPLTTK